jgi:hypothetical protein
VDNTGSIKWIYFLVKIPTEARYEIRIAVRLFISLSQGVVASFPEEQPPDQDSRVMIKALYESSAMPTNEVYRCFNSPCTLRIR